MSISQIIKKTIHVLIEYLNSFSFGLKYLNHFEFILLYGMKIFPISYFYLWLTNYLPVIKNSHFPHWSEISSLSHIKFSCVFLFLLDFLFHFIALSVCTPTSYFYDMFWWSVMINTSSWLLFSFKSFLMPHISFNFFKWMEDTIIKISLQFIINIRIICIFIALSHCSQKYVIFSHLLFTFMSFKCVCLVQVFYFSF